MWSLPAVAAIVLVSVASAAAAVPPPPGPPPRPDSPVMAAAIDEAEKCFFEENWPKARHLRFRAEDAERDLTAPPGSPQWNAVRDIVDQFVRSRAALAHCIDAFRKHDPDVNETENTRVAYRFYMDWMTENYFGQRRYEKAILISLFDKEAGAHVLTSQYE